MQSASFTLIIATRCEGNRKRGRLLLQSPPVDPVPKGKKMKVLTHRPRYIEPAVVPEFSRETSSAAETRVTAPIAQSTEEPVVMPKLPSVQLVETKTDKDKAEGLKVEKITKNARDFEPVNRDNSAESTKGFCRNS